MGYKGNSVQGEIPESGAIFMSNIKTKRECVERKLFGLPSGMSDFVLHVKEGMPLFLFEFERRILYGVFRATCDGDINIEPKAFRSSGKHFPAQVRFTTVWDCSPLAENEFKDVIRDNYYTGKKFHFGLNEKQVSKLMKLFRSNILSKNHPERNIWRYDDKPSEGKARSRDRRRDIRDRVRFDSCDARGDEVKEVDDNMYINKHIIEARQEDKREDFLTLYTTESDEFGDCGSHDILGKHLDPRERHIEDDYMPVFSKPHGMLIDEIGGGSSGFLMESEIKDITDYNRLHDEYKVRKEFWGRLGEHPLTNHVFSPIDQHVYSNSDSMRIDVPDIQLSPPCFDDGSNFIPIANECPFYPSPEKIPMSKSLSYYPHDEESIRYLDDPGSQSSIFPKFISRKLSSDDDLRVHEVDQTDNDKRFYEPHENKHMFATTNKRGSVFSRLSSTLRHEEQAVETDVKHELNSSVDKVMKMLENVVSNPIKRTRKSSSVIKQDGDDNFVDGKIKSHEFPDVNLEVDADMAFEEVEGESVFQETRLLDFKRRKNLNKRMDDASNESSECLVGATSDTRPVETNQLTGTSRKRRKLVRPAFVEKNFIPDGVSAHEENTVSKNDSVLTKVVSTRPAFVEKNFIPNGVSAHEESSVSENDSVSTKMVSARPAFVEKSSVPDGVSVHEEHTVPENNRVCVSTKVVSARPAFVEESSIPDGVLAHEEHTVSENNSVSVEVAETSEKVDVFVNSTDDMITVPTSFENTPDDSNSTKAGIKSPVKVDAFINYTDDMITVPTSLENTPGDCNSTKAGIKSSVKVNAFINYTDDMITVLTSLENTPDDCNSTKARTESSEKVDAFINSTDDMITVPISLENTPDDRNSTKARTESSEKVDALVNSTDDMITVTTSLENTPDDGNSTKARTESSEKVDSLINSMDDMIAVPTSLENTPDDGTSTKTGIESLEKVDALVNSMDDMIMEPTSLENSPDDGNLTEAGIESSVKVDAFINSTDDMITVRSSLENTSDDGNSTKAGTESSVKVDAFINSTDYIITVPTSLENTPDDGNSTKAGIESSVKADSLIKHIDLNMLPSSDESSSSKDDTNSTKASLESLHMSTAECEEKGNVGDGNTVNRMVSGVFVEGIPLALPKDDQKMCGWIEW